MFRFGLILILILRFVWINLLVHENKDQTRQDKIDRTNVVRDWQSSESTLFRNNRSLSFRRSSRSNSKSLLTYEYAFLSRSVWIYYDGLYPTYSAVSRRSDRPTMKVSFTSGPWSIGWMHTCQLRSWLEPKNMFKNMKTYTEYDAFRQIGNIIQIWQACRKNEIQPWYGTDRAARCFPKSLA